MLQSAGLDNINVDMNRGGFIGELEPIQLKKHSSTRE